MIDNSAERYVFIDTFFVQHHVFPLRTFAKPKNLHGFSGNQVTTMETKSLPRNYK